MKVYAIISVILLLTMLFVPLFSLLGGTQGQAAVSYVTEAAKSKEKTKTKKNAGKDEETQGDKPVDEEIKVLRTASGKIENVDMREYIICCVASEMLPSYEKEALKAQAVISYTYALYMLSKPCSEKADITDNSSVHQAYKNRKEIKEKWGDSYEECIKKIEEAVSETSGEYLTYEGKLIKPAYHAMSSGRTNSALDVWGSDIPYLQSVTSDGDRLSPKFISTYDFTENEMKETLSALSGKTIDKIKIGSSVTNTGGYVTKIEISDFVFSGEELRKAFSLRSGAFTLTQKDGVYKFTCQGYGHGVGLSQNGAQYMAKTGSTYDEILRHYYTGVEIKT